MANVDGAHIVVPVDLEAAGAVINARANEMAEQLRTLWSQLETLQGVWTGSAQTYYQGLQQEWNTAAAGLFAPDGVLGQIAAAMNVNWGNYADAAAANVTTWQSR